MTGLHHPGRYLHADAGVVIVPGRVAAWMDRAAGLSQLRIDRRGLDPELDAVLLALAVAAASWRSSATGTAVAVAAEPEPSSQWLTCSAAAELLGIGDRAVRKAITENRLPATRHGSAWRICREDVEQFRAVRAA